MIAQEEKADNGDITIRKGASVGYLSQIPDYKKYFTVENVLNSAFSDLNNVENQMIILEKKFTNLKGKELDKVLKQYSNLQQNFEVLGGYEKSEKFSKICEGLKLEKSFLEKHFELLSGGQKSIVMLGKILLENPDILLLDEPTNHLDADSLDWLESYLGKYNGTVIIVSHDRYFLDRVVNKIVEIDNKISTIYFGNYSYYIKERDKELLLQLHSYNEQKKKIESMEESIKRLRTWAGGQNEKFIRRAISMEKRLEKMDKIDRPKLEKKT